MTLAMRPPLLSMTSALIACALTNCASPSRTDIPNIVPYGATEGVAAAAEGLGGLSLDGLAMSPLAEVWDPAELPLVQKPKVAIWYQFPVTARDKLSRRGATIMYVVYDTVVWGDEEAESKGLQPLGGVTDLRNGDQGLTFATTAVPESFVRSMNYVSTHYRLPYAQGGGAIQAVPAGAVLPPSTPARVPMSPYAPALANPQDENPAFNTTPSPRSAPMAPSPATKSGK